MIPSLCDTTSRPALRSRGPQVQAGSPGCPRLPRWSRSARCRTAAGDGASPPAAHCPARRRTRSREFRAQADRWAALSQQRQPQAKPSPSRRPAARHQQPCHARERQANIHRTAPAHSIPRSACSPIHPSSPASAAITSVRRRAAISTTAPAQAARQRQGVTTKLTSGIAMRSQRADQDTCPNSSMVSGTSLSAPHTGCAAPPRSAAASADSPGPTRPLGRVHRGRNRAKRQPEPRRQYRPWVQQQHHAQRRAQHMRYAGDAPDPERGGDDGDHVQGALRRHAKAGQQHIRPRHRDRPVRPPFCAGICNGSCSPVKNERRHRNCASARRPGRPPW